VFFTGAGVSTAAGIADYRGPTGKWTRQRMKKLQAKSRPTASERAELNLLEAEAKKKGKAGSARGGFGLQTALPTAAHMAMSTMVRLGLASHVVTTNLDGLHRKSGLEHHKNLTCLHGDIYIERCTGCGHECERDYHVRNNARRKLNVHDHSIGVCTKCGSKPPKTYTGKKGRNDDRSGLVCPEDRNCGTKDTHINFGEDLDDIDWNEAEGACSKADLCIVVGTSMSLRHVTHMPFMAQKTVIINLQKTPDDSKADLRIFSYADPVLTALMERLNIKLDPVPALNTKPKLPAVMGRTGMQANTTAAAPPASARSMRSHICAVQKAGPPENRNAKAMELIVQPKKAVGVSVRGREVVKVTKGSQAEELGVQAGWILSHVSNKEMPLRGQAAADAITTALAAGKQGGKQYRVRFLCPKVGNASLVARPPSGSKASPASKGRAFSGFSSGLGQPNRTTADLIDAHKGLIGMCAQVLDLEGAAGA